MAAASEENYDWAKHLIWMEGGPPLPPTHEEAAKFPLLAGILLTTSIAFVAAVLSQAPFWPFTLPGGAHPLDKICLAILLGILIGNVWPLAKSYYPGIKFSVKKILPLGVVLLGARLNFNDLISIGTKGILLSIGEVLLALILFIFFIRIFRLDQKLGLLLGAGTAICGGTAIVAIAPTIDAKEEQVVIGVATVTLLGLFSMFLLPVLGHFFQLSPTAFGAWAGLSIHQTPQVIASGFAYGELAGETATIVKLSRVCLLAPVVLLVMILYNRQNPSQSSELSWTRILKLFPYFVLGFILMALLETFQAFPEMTLDWSGSQVSLEVNSFLAKTSGFLLAISMAGVGLETQMKSLRNTALTPFLVSALGALIITLISFFAALWAY